MRAERPIQAPLRPGTILNGRVVDILPGGLLQINFGKFRAQTRVRFPVAKGDNLRFEVLATGNQIKLKIQDPPPPANKDPIEQSFRPEDLQRFRQQLEAALRKPGLPGFNRGQTESLRLQIARLSRLLPSLQPGRSPDQLAPLVKALLVHSGVFFEKKLETVLLQLFKSPREIDVGRAAAHPFVTHILDNDLKPNLLKLAAILPKSAGERESQLAPLRTAALNFIKQIEVAQARLIRAAPIGPGKTAAAYPRANSSTNLSNGGLPRPNAANLPAATMKILQLQLVKTGLWSDPQIRPLLPELMPAPGPTVGRFAGPTFAPQQRHGPVAGHLTPDTKTIEKGALQKSLDLLLKIDPDPGSKSLAPLLSAYRGYLQANQLRIDATIEKALNQLEAFNRTPKSYAGSPGPETSRRVAGARQNLQILAQFIESRLSQERLKSTAPQPKMPRNTSLTDKHAPAETNERLPGFGKPSLANGGTRSTLTTNGREIARIVNLIKPKATALGVEFERIEETLGEVTANKKSTPPGKKLSRAVRTLQVLIERNQVPTGETVHRALASLATLQPTSGKALATPLGPGPLSENLLADLAVLREFINLQKTELSETLDLLRGLLGRTDAETETGDRPGTDRGRGTDALQVITFSLPMEEGQKPARLKVFYPLKKNAAAGTGFRISLLLSMERMGPVRADIFAYQQNLEVKFSTANESVRRHIDGHLSRLGDLLNGAFETVNLTAAVDEKNIAAFEYEDLEMSGDRLVDLQA